MSINQFNTELMQLMHKHGVKQVKADDYKVDVVMRHCSDVQSSDSNPLLFGKSLAGHESVMESLKQEG